MALSVASAWRKAAGKAVSSCILSISATESSVGSLVEWKRPCEIFSNRGPTVSCAAWRLRKAEAFILERRVSHHQINNTFNGYRQKRPLEQESQTWQAGFCGVQHLGHSCVSFQVSLPLQAATHEKLSISSFKGLTPRVAVRDAVETIPCKQRCFVLSRATLIRDKSEGDWSIWRCLVHGHGFACISCMTSCLRQGVVSWMAARTLDAPRSKSTNQCRICFFERCR